MGEFCVDCVGMLYMLVILFEYFESVFINMFMWVEGILLCYFDGVDFIEFV